LDGVKEGTDRAGDRGLASVGRMLLLQVGTAGGKELLVLSSIIVRLRGGLMLGGLTGGRTLPRLVVLSKTRWSDDLFLGILLRDHLSLYPRRRLLILRR
jgi:hypothetical protein